jgi:hypothetical protein
MKILRVKFISSIRIGTKEFTFLDCEKEKIEVTINSGGMDCLHKGKSVGIPLTNVAYFDYDKQEQLDLKKKV